MPWIVPSKICQELYVSSISSNLSLNRPNLPITSHSMTLSTAKTLIWAWNTQWKTSISAEESYPAIKIEADTSYTKWMDLWSAVHQKEEASPQRQPSRARINSREKDRAKKWKHEKDRWRSCCKKLVENCRKRKQNWNQRHRTWSRWNVNLSQLLKISNSTKNKARIWKICWQRQTTEVIHRTPKKEKLMI